MAQQILIIDDDEDEFTIFKEAVKAAGYQFDCRFVQGCDEALSLLNNLDPYVIFVDYNMPRVNGIECVRRIRQREALANVPVILYSTGLDNNLTLNGLAAGASGCIKKADSIAQFASLLLSFFSIHGPLYSINKQNV